MCLNKWVNEWVPFLYKVMPLILSPVNVSWLVFIASLNTVHLRDCSSSRLLSAQTMKSGLVPRSPFLSLVPLLGSFWPLGDLLCHFNSFYKWGSEKLTDPLKVILLINCNHILKIGLFPTIYTVNPASFMYTYFYWCFLRSDQCFVSY